MIQQVTHTFRTFQNSLVFNPNMYFAKFVVTQPIKAAVPTRNEMVEPSLLVCACRLTNTVFHICQITHNSTTTRGQATCFAFNHQLPIGLGYHTSNTHAQQFVINLQSTQGGFAMFQFVRFGLGEKTQFLGCICKLQRPFHPGKQQILTNKQLAEKGLQTFDLSII